VDSNNFLFNLSVKHVLEAVEKIKLRRYMLPLFGGIYVIGDYRRREIIITVNINVTEENKSSYQIP
jgi:hypothetical protein